MKLKINRQEVNLSKADLSKNLLAFIRENLDLTGTKKGCGIGVCGTCTILVDNQPTTACKKTVNDVLNKELLTIEGMSDGDTLHPLQQAFIDAGAIQCGFCTPGMILTSHAFLLKNHKPSRDEIRKALSPNLCRCTGYQQIIDAVELAAKYYKEQK